MWGSADGWRDAQLGRDKGDVCRSMLPGAEDRPESCEVGGLVGNGNGGGLVDGGVVAGVSALGLTHGKRP